METDFQHSFACSPHPARGHETLSLCCKLAEYLRVAADLLVDGLKKSQKP